MMQVNVHVQEREPTTMRCVDHGDFQAIVIGSPGGEVRLTLFVDSWEKFTQRILDTVPEVAR